MALDVRTERHIGLDAFSTEQLQQELARREPPEPRVRAFTVSFVSDGASLHAPGQIVSLPKSIAEQYLRNGHVTKPTKEQLAAVDGVKGEETSEE